MQGKSPDKFQLGVVRVDLSRWGNRPQLQRQEVWLPGRRTCGPVFPSICNRACRLLCRAVYTRVLFITFRPAPRLLQSGSCKTFLRQASTFCCFGSVGYEWCHIRCLARVEVATSKREREAECRFAVCHEMHLPPRVASAASAMGCSVGCIHEPWPARFSPRGIVQHGFLVPSR